MVQVHALSSWCSTPCLTAAGGMCKKHINLQFENNLPIGDVAFSAQAISGFLLLSSRSLHTLSLVSKQFSLLNKSLHVALGNCVTNHAVLLLSELLPAAHRYSLNGTGQAEKTQSRKIRCILVKHKHKQQNMYDLLFFFFTAF